MTLTSEWSRICWECYFFCFVFPFFSPSPSYSSVLAVHLITTVLYISLLSEWENVCAWVRLGSNCIIMIQAVLLTEFIVRVWRHKELCHLIKQRHGMHKYSHKNLFHDNCITIHYYSYLVKQGKVKLTHTETQHPCTHRVACMHAHAHTHTRIDCMCIS